MTDGVLHSDNDAGLLSDFERRLLNDYQRDFPLSSYPFAEIAAAESVAEEAVLDAFERFAEAGLITRIGAVIKPHRLGWSTLAAMAVPEERLEEVALLVNGYEEVNHNYEREHHLNLWFVVTGESPECVSAVLADIERRSGLKVLDLPLEEAFTLDLGFQLQW